MVSDVKRRAFLHGIIINSDHRSYGGIIPTDVFANLGSEWISGIISLSGITWRSMVSFYLLSHSICSH